jgi:hypothetical protein
MNKQELINAIASGASLSKVEADRALNATTDAITHALAQGSVFPALNAATLEALILIVLPVCGFLPVRAARALTTKEPKPVTGLQQTI